ncbi:MAG: ABC transporter permease [Terracidiphilus sp.]|jgi:predicted permease
MFRILFKRCAALFGTRRSDTDLDEELQAHLDIAVHANVQSGMTREEARMAALRSFGGITQTKERYRSQRGLPFIETVARDIRYARRQLRKSPGFTLTAVLTLAVGIGGVTAVYTVVEAVLLRPLPFYQPERLVRLHEGVEHQFDSADLPAPDVIRFARDSQAFSQVAGFVSAGFEVSGAGKPFQAKAERISASLLPLLGVQPMLGRAFTQSEDEDSSPVAVISYAMWRERFQSSARAIGATIDLDRRPFTIVGVMPRSFEFPLDAGRLSHRDMWVPMSFTPDEKQDETDNFQYGAIARLKPGITLAQAQSDVRRMVASIEAEIPPQDGIHLTSNVRFLQEETVHGARPLLNTLLAAAGLILLIACANLANLLLVRTAGRRREFGMRIALGAARRAILRQLLTESLVLAALGGALGIVLAFVLVHLAAAVLPDSLPRLSEIAVRWPVLLVAMGLTGVTGILCGWAPALAGIKSDAMDSMREGSPAAGQGRAQHRMRSVLAVVEVALAMLLLVASGLLLRSFQKMLATDPGFEPQHVLTASLDLPEHDYPTEQKVDAFYRELLRQLGGLPQVRSVGLASNIPVIGIGSDRNFVPEGYAPHDGRAWLSVSNYFVLGDYFRAMRIPLLEGRYFTAADDLPNAPLVAIVSQSAARQHWPGVDAVGKRFRMGGNPKSTRPLITVVGIVGDVRQGALDQAVYPQMYEPLEQHARQFEAQVQQAIGPYRSLYVALNSAGNPAAIETGLEKTVHGIDPLLAVTDMYTMEQVVAATETSRRFNTAILTAFASIALALSLLGIYGVLAYSVNQQAREIAIRMALGANRGQVLWRTLRNALALAGVGVAAGLVASAGLTRFLASLLFDVKPLDPGAVVGAAALLLACSALAGWLPARRAASIDPIKALRTE